MTFRTPGEVEIANLVLMFLRGVRTSENLRLASSAINVQEQLEEELKESTRIQNVVHVDDDEFESVVNFSLKGQGTTPEASTGPQPEEGK